MADPRRTLVLEALKSRLEAMDGTGAWAYAATVHHGGEVTPDDIQPGTAAVVMLPGRATLEGGAMAQKLLMTLPVTVRGVVLADVADPLDAVEPLLADLKRALFHAADHTLGGVATFVRFVAEETMHRIEGGKVAAAEVELAVQYWERYGAPDVGE